MIAGARAFLLSAALALVALCGCMAGGNSGSETTNGLTGVVHDRKDAPVAGARVMLLREDHNGARPEGSVKPRETLTDVAGAYSFQDIVPGTYNLEISDAASGTLARIPGITLEADAAKAAGIGILDRPGSVELPLPDFLAGGKPGYLYLPGTTVYVRVDSAARARGTVVLEPVAAGAYPSLLLVVEENDREPVTLAEEIKVEAGVRTVLAPYLSWKYSRSIAVGPVSGGAGDTAVHRDFPFLVRLGANTFDFSQAASDGRDIRFTDAAGDALAYELERWDSAAGQAEIWVKLKSIRWDVAGQSITMRWGRAGASPVSSGAAVFTAGAGFSSVWHLTEAGNELPGGYRDATAQGNHATANGINKTSLLDGAVGLCKSFSGDLGTLTAKVPSGFAGDASFTVSFWMKAGVMPFRSNIMNFGGTVTYQGFHFLIRADTTAQFGAHDSDGPGGVNGTAAWQNVFSLRDHVGKWTHVAMVYDAAARKTTTWMDGIRKSESDAPAAGFQLDAAGGLRIGKALFGSTESNYDGQLDEIRFQAAPLTESRIRLDYETQKP